MNLWYQCWDYRNYEESPNSVHNRGDYGILRCSHISHCHGDEATLELQHQRDTVWFDRATDPTRPDQPKMSSGDALINCSNYQQVYNAPGIAEIKRMDDRRVVVTYSEDFDLPYHIQHLNQNNVSWIIDTMLDKEGIGFPREERVDFISSRVPEPRYEVDPILNMRKGSGMVIIDARKSGKPWQSAYMMNKIKPMTQEIYDVCRNTPVDGRTSIFYVASGLSGVEKRHIRGTRRELINSIANCVGDMKNISLGKIDCRVWTSWELAYQVRAYPDMMKHIVQTMFAKTGHRKAQ